jgi:hypothetical protein
VLASVCLHWANVALQVLYRKETGQVVAPSWSEGERESKRALEGSWLPPLSTRVSENDGEAA